jgi:hypothetical protein
VNRFDDNPTILRGIAKVLEALAETDNLRRSVGQHTDLSTDLFLILSRHNSRGRRPVVVLLRREGVVSAAVIFAERCVLGLGVGLLRAGDQTGDGAVIAHPCDRKAALLAATRALLDQWRCHTVAATLNGVSSTVSDIPAGQRIHAESSYRMVRRYMALSPTLDETLSERFTAKKRKNLLYYRRNLAKKYDVEFVPRIAPEEIEAAILQLARHSWPRRSKREVDYHCKFLRRHAQSFCMGLRLEDGAWLSLVTGWRADGTTHVPWQLNHDEFKNESLMQVMRTYMLEHECALGQTALSWVGGTVAFQTACDPESCLDIIEARRGIRSALLRSLLAPYLFHRNPHAFTGGSLMLLLPPHNRGFHGVCLDPDS